MNRIDRGTLVNALTFQLLWFAAVAGAAHGWAWLAWPVLLTMVSLQGRGRNHWQRDVLMLLTGALFCLITEPVWLVVSLLKYVHWSDHWLAPHWVWALWLGFAVSFHYSLRWLQGRWWLASMLGAFGSVVSVSTGIKLGAAVAPQGWLPLALVYGVVWALAAPLMAVVARRLEDNLGGHYA
ncbi:MAG: DUF2878 domain-containing protein [Alcanivorax sp.]|nr:DUF2878 domain-containing protein [Alcanivorax sp.]